MRKFVIVAFLVCIALHGYSQCTLTVNVSASNPSICLGNEVVLTANASRGMAAYRYAWSTGETTASITINKADTYSIIVTDQAGCQQSQSITIAENPAPQAPIANNASGAVCYNTAAKLVATSPGGTYQWYDAPVGGTYLGAGDTFFTPAITVPSTFYVQATIGGCTSTRTAVAVTVIDKPTVSGTTVCSGTAAMLSVGGATSYQWFDAPDGGNLVGTGATFTTPVLTESKTYYVTGTINGCTSQRIAVTANVLPPLRPPTVPSQAVCSGSLVTLEASGSGDVVYDWFTVPAGGVSLISSPDFTTPILTATTTYYVQATLDGCQSSRTPVTVIVAQPPPAPAATSAGTVCFNTSGQLNVTSPIAGQSYQWFSSAVSNTVLFTGEVFTTPRLNTSTTYYVRAINGPCISDRSAVTVIVKNQPDPPAVSGALLICSGSSSTLTAAGSAADTYEWYSAANSGTLLATGASYTTPVLTANKTYYVQSILDGCVSNRATVTVAIIPPPPVPSATGGSTCRGGSVTLVASGGSNYEWYDAQTGGNLLASGQVFITPALSSTQKYYVQNSVNDCVSKRKIVVATVNPVPANPIANNPAPICLGTTAHLTASGSGTLQWYDAATGGALLATGSSYNTPVLTASANYYVQASNATCTSSRTVVNVTVIAATPRFNYISGTFCKSSANPTPTINDPGGTFSATPAGLVFANATTGEINIAASLPGNYTITYSGSVCSGSSNVKIAIVATPNATFNYGQTNYCQDDSNPLPAFTGTGSAGVFSSTTGLVFTNTNSGQINLAASTPGTYTITNTISGGCQTETHSESVTIEKRVIINAGPDQIIATGTTANLSGSVNLSGLSLTWSAPSGYFSDEHAVNPVYTPTVTSGTVVLTLTSDDPAGVCGAQADQVTITINPKPAMPTVIINQACNGDPASLSATAPGGTYKWYATATDSSPLATGANFITPALTADATYYVETTVNGVTSDRAMVAVQVTAILPPPMVSGITDVCKNSSTVLTASGASSATYQWYDAPSGGKLLATTAEFSTPVILINTTFYVQQMVNSCISSRQPVNITVKPLPAVTGIANAFICSGTQQNYVIHADMPGATFTYSRDAVTGISNPAVNNVSAFVIDETLVNTTGTDKKVTYLIKPYVNGCEGAPFYYNVTVYPSPVITSAESAIICNGSAVNYVTKVNTSLTGFSWSRAAVPGIKNQGITGQASSTIREVLYNTTNAPVEVYYMFTYTTGACSGTFMLKVTVNPSIYVTSPTFNIMCDGEPQSYSIQSNINEATFRWSRASVSGISNAPVVDQTSQIINEKLINTTNHQVQVYYDIIPVFNRCDGTRFSYHVAVDPQPATPVINSNTPVCINKIIHLQTAAVTGATYVWTGPNGFTSSLQSPDITNVITANTGTYNLTVIVNRCSSEAAHADIVVNQPPTVMAGNDITACPGDAKVSLHGSVTRGANGPILTGEWKTSGTGRFLLANDLNAQYLPSDEDKRNKTVTLTLYSTSTDDCDAIHDEVVINFSLIQQVNAGQDFAICQSDKAQLNGKINIAGGGIWSTSGDGRFDTPTSQLNAVYAPGPNDIAKGSVTLKLTANAPGACDDPDDELIVSFAKPVTINAGGTKNVLKGTAITLNPVVSDKNVQYLWLPDIGLSNNTIMNPVVTGNTDITYTLRVTNAAGCVSTDQVQIKVFPSITVPNTFTPNGDGFNDLWEIKGVDGSSNVVIDVFNRYGQRVYHSIGYGYPWDGSTNGTPLSFGTYYYIIEFKELKQRFSGSITIVK